MGLPGTATGHQHPSHPGNHVLNLHPSSRRTSPGEGHRDSPGWRGVGLRWVQGLWQQPGLSGSQSPAPPAAGGESARETSRDWQREVWTWREENRFPVRAVQRWSRGHKAVGPPFLGRFRSNLMKSLADPRLALLPAAGGPGLPDVPPGLACDPTRDCSRAAAN